MDEESFLRRTVHFAISENTASGQNVHIHALDGHLHRSSLRRLQTASHFIVLECSFMALMRCFEPPSIEMGHLFKSSLPGFLELLARCKARLLKLCGWSCKDHAMSRPKISRHSTLQMSLFLGLLLHRCTASMISCRRVMAIKCGCC